MNNSAPIVQRAQKRERDKFLPGVVVSFTTLSHPPARFGHRPRTVGLIELENGRRVLAPLVMDAPYIGQGVRPRMRLSHVTHEGLRVYEVAYDAAAATAIQEAYSRYIFRRRQINDSENARARVLRLCRESAHSYHPRAESG